MSSFSPTQRHDHFIESSKDEGIFLRLREVSPIQSSSSKGAVLCVHGAVLSGILFDIPVKNASWLDYFAQRDVNAFALDLRGYGRSTKPKAMDKPEKEVAPVCTHYDALCDIADAVDYMRSKLLVDKVTIIGLSWGSLLVGDFAHKHPHLVQSLILIGPVYSYKNPMWAPLLDPNDPTKKNPHIGGYRIVHKESMRTLWDLEIPVDDKSLWRDPLVWQAIEDDMLHGDNAWAASRSAHAIRSPAGVVDDVVAMYNGHLFYPAKDIMAPTLILRGDHDTSSHAHDMDHLFKQLGSDIKQYVQIGNASHYALAEKKAPLMMGAAYDFMMQSSLMY